MKVGLKGLVAAVAFSAMAFSASSQAAIYRWSFDVIGHDDFIFLDFDTDTNDFRLFDNTADAYLNSQLGVNGISFDFNGAQTMPLSTSTVLGAYGNTTIGTLTQTTQPSLLTGYVVGYATPNNNDDNEINDGQSTMFNFGAIAFSNIDNVAIRLNASNGALNSSGTWVGGTLVQNTPVPEAETSAMMVLGLGVLGFVARRRKQA